MSTKPRIPQFQLERSFTAGYLDKIPNYEMPDGAAQLGTTNFVVDDQGKWSIRPGTKYLGTKSSDTGGCRNAHVLVRRDGVEIPVVQYGTKLKYLHPSTLDWCVLLTGLSSTAIMGFAPSDLGTDPANVLVMSDGVDAYQYWNGATGVVASSTASTITFNTSQSLAALGFNIMGTLVDPNGVQYTYAGTNKSGVVASVTGTTIVLAGSQTLAQLGFSASGSISSNGITYTYTSILGNTFSGVTPDPTQGNILTVATITTNTITISGTAALGSFTPAFASGSVIINGITFTYSGVSGETFTGVSPDPTTDGIIAGQIVIATTIAANAVVTQTGATPTFVGVTPDPSGLTIGTAMADSTVVPDVGKTFKGTVLAATQYGRVVMGDVTKAGTLSGNGSVFVSAVDSYTDFTFSSPRVTGQGALLNAPSGGGSCKGIQPFENGFVVAKDKVIYSLQIEDGSTIPFQLGILVPYEGSISPLSFFPSENTINYVTNNHTISSLQRVQQYDQFSQALPMSDPIKNTMSSLFFDQTSAGVYFTGIDYYSMKSASTDPVNDRILSFNKRYGSWNSPWLGLNIAAFFVYAAELYLCDAATPDVYRIGSVDSPLYNDFMTQQSPGFSIPGTLIMRANNFGAPAVKKEFTEYWIEGEMFLSDTVTFALSYDNGSESVSGTIAATDAGLIYTPGGGFGTESFGVDTFGQGSTGSQSLNEPSRFRMIVTTELQSFYEATFSVVSTGFFRLINHGPKLVPSSEVPNDSIYQALS